MNASRPPRLATWLLTRLVSGEHAESLVGDLIERQRRSQHSSAWYWRQTLTAIAFAMYDDVCGHGVITLRAILTGWLILLSLFAMGGDFVANGLAYRLTGWTREIGYGQRIWPPFWLTAWLVSYGGFAISGWLVGRTHSASAVVAYATSVLAVLTASAAFFATRGPIQVPHTLFYVVSIGLPYQWRTGLVLAPAVVTIAGLWAVHQETTGELRDSET